jgi:hypothetical protein
VTGRAGRWYLDVRPRAQRQLERLPEKIATAAAEFMTGALLENPRRVGHPLQDEYAGQFPHTADVPGAFATGSTRALAESSSWTFLIARTLTVRNE